MKINGSTFFLSILLLLCGLAVGSAQQLDVDRELEEAKSLYREAKFAQAVAKLQGTIVRLEQLRDLQARRIQLSDAHLHLALSYVALNDPAAAKESLKQMLRADRNRKLDPDVYAPKVIELFEEAKKEVAVEPAAAAPSPPSATAKKGGSKAPLILIGAAAAAGGGIAVAKGGGGTTGAAPAATPTPTPTQTVSGPNDIAFLGSVPPTGSTIKTGTSLIMSFSVVHSASLQNVQLQVALGGEGRQPFSGQACASLHTELFSLTAGQPRTVSGSFGGSNLLRAACSPLPFTTTIVGAALHGCDPTSTPSVPVCIGAPVMERLFLLSYTIVP